MAFVPSFGAGDAVAAQTLDKQKVFTDWLTANNQQGKGIITEVGIPGSSAAATDPIPGSGTGAKFDIRWDNVLQQWYEGANRANLGVTYWNVSNWRVDLRAWENADGSNKPFTHRTTASSVLLNNLSGKNGVTAPRGVNMAGGEFSDRGPNGSLDRSHIAQPGAGYYYPAAADIQIMKNAGFDFFRFPIRWERVQPTLKAALDETEMAYIDAVYTAAAKSGIKVLLDLHNYARYDTTPTGANANGVYTLGQNAPSGVTGTMNDCFADLWSRLATRYKNNTASYGFDICNEPHDCPAGVSDWQTASRAAVEAIRAVDQNVIIAIEGYLYASVPGWLSQNGSSAWMTQTIPAGQTNAGQTRNNDPNIRWNGHHYFDQNYNGGFEDSYDSELTSAQNAGYASYATSGYTAPATNNTQQTGFRNVFASDFSDAGDFSGTYDGINANSNTVTLPSTDGGNPSPSLKIVTSAKSDEGSVRKSLTGNVGRIVSFDIFIPTAGTISTTDSFTINHNWRDDNSTDFFEVRILGVSPGYIVGLTIPSGTYAFNNSLATVLQKGVWNSVKAVVTDTAINLYVNGGTTVEATISGSYGGTNPVNIGGLALGKFYATSYVGTLYYDNLAVGINATYYAPPNGGLITTSSSTTPTTPTNPTNPTTPTTPSTTPTTGGVSGNIFRDNGTAGNWVTASSAVAFGGNFGFTGTLGASPSIHMTYPTGDYPDVSVKKSLSATATIWQFMHRVASTATIGNGAPIFTAYSTNAFNAASSLIRVDVTPIAGSTTTYKYSFVDPSNSYTQTIGTTSIATGTDVHIVISQNSSGWKLWINNNSDPEVAYTYNQATVGSQYFTLGSFNQAANGALTGVMDFGEIWVGNLNPVPTTAAGTAYEMYQGYIQRHLAVSGQPYKFGTDGSNNSYVNGYIDTVSEGVAYIEYLEVQNNDQVSFILTDNWVIKNMLRKFSTTANTANNAAPTTALNLMAFHYNSANTDGKGRGTIYDANFATDADVERMQALFWAHARWGSSTSTVGSTAELTTPNYLQRGLDVANDLRQYAFSNSSSTGFNYLWNDAFQSGNVIQTGGDYSSPAAFQLAANYDTMNSTFWTKAVSGAYDAWTKAANVIFSGGTAANGGAQSTTAKLNPNWFQYKLDTGTVLPTPSTYDTSAGSTAYAYNAFRIYPRLAEMYAFYGDTAANTVLALPATTFSNKWSSNSKIPVEMTHEGTVTGNYEKAYFTWAAVYSLQAANNTTLANTIISSRLTNRFLMRPQGAIYNQTGDTSVSFDYYGQSWSIRNYMFQQGLLKNYLPGSTTTPTTPVTNSVLGLIGFLI